MGGSVSWIDDQQDLWDEYEDQEKSEQVCIEWTCRKASTDKAVLLTVHGVDHWIPRSLLLNTSKDGGRFSTGGSGEIPMWFADQEDIFY
jgi:hypothetical protein